jgi:hypothetical protein
MKILKLTGKIFKAGLAAILFGLLAALLALFLQEKFKPTTFPPTLAIKFLGDIGIALFSVGLIGIILDFKDWSVYFQDRLAEIIIQKKYLYTLNESQLINLQTDTLKAFFKLDDIDRKGSFLEFFHSKIRKLIGSPFREHIQGVVEVSYNQAEDCYVIDDTTTYKCRKVGDTIQGEVSWKARREEVLEILDYTITLQIPHNFFQSPDFKAAYPEYISGKREFKKGSKELIDAPDGHGFSLSLSDLKEIDELSVKLHIKYKSPGNRHLPWTMTHPTYNLSLVINHPSELEVAVDCFGMEGSGIDEDIKPQTYSLKYDSWLLPSEGLVYHFRRRKT